MFNEFGRFEQQFADWRRDGMPGLKSDSFKYIEFLSDPQDELKPRPGTLWDHQWDAFLRVIYSFEILGKREIGESGLLLNIVTGGGKTAIIAAIMAWMRIAHDAQKFLMLCPGLVVRDRLEDDFTDGKVFITRDLLPKWSSLQTSDFVLTTLGSDRESGYATLLSSSVILGNIHQFYIRGGQKTGQSNTAGLMNGPDFVIFNDEAHNSPAPEYEAALERLKPKTMLRIDTTATPDRADNTVPDSDMIYEYGINEALFDGIVKTPVVYQPDIAVVQLTYTDAKTGEKRSVEEIDWSEVDRLGLSATQWVTDDKPMRQQMAIALKRLEEQELRARGRYQPILFVVAVCKLDAEMATRTLNNYFKIKTLMVTEDSDEADRQKAKDLGRQQKTDKPYKAVVSILMLREGWDVPEVGVILLLRKFGSRVYGQQVIGRGLRRVRTAGVAPDEPQICAIVDHPKLEHEWLWELLNAKVHENVGIDQLFNEMEDLPAPPPKQIIDSPEKIVDVPDEDPTLVDDGEFDIGKIDDLPEPVEDWKEKLAEITYEAVSTEITRVDITGVRGRELGGAGWLTISSSPDMPEAEAVSFKASNDEMREALKAAILEMALDLTVDAGCAAGFRDKVYSAIMAHIRSKFMGGNSIGLAEREELDFAWKMLQKVRKQVEGIPGLIEGIVEYGN